MVISTAGHFAGPCFRCEKPLEAGTDVSTRNGRRYHVPCEPNPLCPLCGARSETGYGCELHLAIAGALGRFQEGVTRSFERRLTLRLRQLFRPAHRFETAPEPGEQIARRVFGR